MIRARKGDDSQQVRDALACRRRRSLGCLQSHARGEPRVPGVVHKRHELFPFHADQLLVIARFEIDFRLVSKAVVDYRGHAVGQADGRDGPQLTIAE